MPKPTSILSLPNELLGRELHIFDTLASTNDTAMSLARSGSGEGIAILALNQTAGRGQQGRIWNSSPGSSLLLSLIWHPTKTQRQPARIIAMTALAVSRTVRQLIDVQPQIKWPNDILIDRRKLCGILVEQTVIQQVDGPIMPTVIGIGLNLNQNVNEFVRMELPEATSLLLESDRRFDVVEVATQLLTIFDTLLKEENTTIEREWVAGLALVGKAIELRQLNGSTQKGILLKASFAEVELLCKDGTRRTLPPETIRHMNEL